MADNIKIIGEVNDTRRLSRIKDEDLKLISTTSQYKTFGAKDNYIQYIVRDNEGTILHLSDDYSKYKLPPNAVLTPEGNYPVIEINPVKDLEDIGFISGQFTTQYNFNKSVIAGPTPILFISEISEDRTEVRFNSTILLENQLTSWGQYLGSSIENSNEQINYILNFPNNKQFLIINVAVDFDTLTPTLLLKLYDPLPLDIVEKTLGWISEEIIEPYIFTIDLNTSITLPPTPQLKGPNFDVDLDIKQNLATKYESYDSLVSALTGSSYHRVLNYMNDNSYDLNIDYTSFENFIHFSSAKKRLEIFYSKVKQIEDYNTDISTILSSTSILKNEETASIKLKIDDIARNFDGFENYMYFESSSYAWPKSSNIKPYTLLSTSSLTLNTWYNSYTRSAELYDETNLDHLYNTLPEYIRSDSTNYQPYFDFIDMIGHYFDNIWIYITSINELYNADNNLEKGVSKDIVYDALKSLGVKLYNSKGDNKFDDYIGGINSGSTLFVDDFSVTSSYLNNIPKKDQLAELYKRIYHNIPLLSKTRGTSAGLQNLITTFGITGSVFSPKEFGGSLKSNNLKGYNNDKIAIQDNTITGSVLSPFISLQNPPTSSSEFTSTDLHFVDLSFSPQNELNTRISASIASTNPTFSLDDYIGDPRLMKSSSYDSLNLFRDTFISASATVSGSAQRLDYKGFIELVKYFDNSLFKMLKDFAPARANTLTGVTIKSPVLERNKIAIHSPNVTEQDIHEATYNTPVISEDRDYYYDKITGNKSSFYTGELTGSYANVNNVFEGSNPNPYLHPSHSIDTNKHAHSDFNVVLNNISSSVLSSSRLKLEPLYLSSNNSVFASSSDGKISEFTSKAELQDSYEDLLGHQNSRYNGTKVYSLKYNEYTTASVNYDGDKSFGQKSAIDHNTIKLGLFTSIEKNEFFKTKKNNIYLKYLVDKEGNLTELNRYNKHWVEVQNIFKGGNNLIVSQFDTQHDGNQKSTDGIKPIYSSGYNYTPMLYITGSSSTDKLWFAYSGEDTLKLFKANNIANGFISGSGNGNETYPLAISGSNSYVIYNIFDNILVNDNSLYKAGTSSSISTANAFPSYSVPANGTYAFNTSFDINVRFPSSNQSCSFKYDIIKGGIDNNGFPTGSILATSGIKTFTTSYQYDVYTRGYNLIPKGTFITNSTNAPINSSYFPIYVGSNLFLDYVSGNQYKDLSNASWYSYIINWDNDGYPTTSLIFSKNSNSPLTFSNDDYITTVSNVSSISNQTNGTLSFRVNSPGDFLQKKDEVYFKLSLLSTITNNFTASFSTPGELRNNLTSNTYGDTVFATGSVADSFISNVTTSSINSGIDTLVFNEGLSAFNNYTFIPNTGSQDQSIILYNKYGNVNDVFNPTVGDIVVTSWAGQSTEFNISNVFNSGSYKCLTLDRNIPNSLVNKIRDVGDTTTAGMDEFILLKKNKDETNLLVTFDKETGNTSYGFIIPDNIHPDILSNIDVITKEVKQKLIENSNTGGSGTF